MTTTDHDAREATSRARGGLVARGARADVFEWRGSEDEGTAPDPVVVKVRRGASARTDTLAEAAALSAVDHPHVVPLLDVVELPEGLGLVLPRLSTESAADFLVARGQITAGEAVTLLVPLLRALVHVQRRGLHPDVRLAPSVSLEDVLFDARGAPIVTNLRAQAMQGLALLDRPSGSPDEVARGIVRRVLATTIGGSRHARTALDSVLRSGGSLDETIEAVFALDAAVPLEAPLPEAEATGPTRTDDNDVSLPASDDEGATTRATSFTGPHVLDALLPGFRSAREILARSSLLRALVDSLRQVRPKVWLTAAVVIASVAGGATLLGQQETSPGHGPGGSPEAIATSRSTDVSSPATSRPSSSSLPTSGPSSSSQASSGPSPSPRPSTDASILMGDDADAATRLLLRLRSACLRALDGACLRGVDSAESPALDADLAAIDDPALLAARPVDVTVAEAVNRLGGSVIYRAKTGASTEPNIGAKPTGGSGGAPAPPQSEPASVLVTRTEAGWRLRDVSRVDE